MSSAPSAPNSAESAPAPFDARTYLETLTEAPGVYRFLDAAGQVLYVGKAKNLKKRVGT